MTSVLTQHPPGGGFRDRAAVATYLLDRGIDVPPDNVVLTAGAQHGLDIVLRVLTRPGALVAVDELTYPGIKLLAAGRAVELAPFPSDADGPDLDALAALCARRPVAAIYTMPTLHNPLGYVLGRRRRRALAEIARRHDCAVIEDGTYAFLHPGSAPTMYSVAPERTFHVASMSKNLATGLRFGFVVTPDGLVARTKNAVRTSSWGTSSIVSALVTAWISDGTVARREAQRRVDARDRQRVASRVLKSCDYSAHPVSYYGWLRLRDDQRSDHIAHLLADDGILVSSADVFCTTPHPPNALRLALGTPSIAQLITALHRISEVVSSTYNR
ncbi:PLP-dependent aminotransferase family protein [Mycolicibacterium chubuense]|uniref:aminotransferase-like domain-containing protein n=1 Tax=Mycolicibacterium chubuense TaxID=1800 RepID=UPI0006843F9D|nr:PLP-dependent aminotransferase family protein [Mycolicibacterium chubuense]